MDVCLSLNKYKDNIHLLIITISPHEDLLIFSFEGQGPFTNAKILLEKSSIKYQSDSERAINQLKLRNEYAKIQKIQIQENYRNSLMNAKMGVGISYEQEIL
ncbi:hypothetical protein TTHERM_01239400 (macronuclear) [Tetrahymena thermophila SB210]|uniref:Uncharacterized protein n=1 Tax=Tetrahymena thermophila (strain SB210) TaxID=312017 RepID=Q228R2_TETTS|nr:hypothetical protein TTHERM_01239400 [Tetrahymena thermophila SB210]EAR86700.1 hypothetical protein TTHERM_01239400 [Tetrahymena thermophila SB210]|eukprot:XP_977295.1 hypothetical protein TTHERM_01239400 [Tetrahymena thermophila SB210]